MTKPSAKLELFRSIAEYTYDWESWIRADGGLGWVNSAVERITGYSVAECMAMRDYPLALVHPGDREGMRRLFRLAAEGGQGNDIEFRVLRKDGEVRWGAVSFQPLLDERLASLGYRASVRDIHDRKEMEAGLEALRERAEAGDRAKTELLARVSHELRTPIHCISGYAELLGRSGSDAERARFAEVIGEQSRVLLRQVEDLLDMATLESGGVRLEREPFSLHEVVGRVSEAKRPLLEAKGLRLTMRVDPKIRGGFVGDAHRLGQVVRNLVENAIKYTDRGTIHIDVSGRPGVAGTIHAQIVVEDSGVGIDREHLPLLTREFVRVAAESHADRAGKGLGLAIADRLVSAMGGTLSIESAVGEGTRVTVAVPLEVDPGPELHRPCAERAPDERLAARVPLRIMVVDDTPGARELLVAQLARLGYSAVACDGGVEALRRVFREDFDLLLLDLWLPDIPGDEIAARVAAAAARAKIPRPRMVAVTASGVGRHGLGERAAAFDAIVPKPLSIRRLEEVIEDLGFEAREPPAGELVDREIAADLRGAVDAEGVDLLERYLERIARDLPAQVAAIRAHLARGDTGEAARRLHSLVGLFAVVGARAAADGGRALLEAWAAGERADEAALDALVAAFHEARAALGRLERRAD